VSGVGTLGLTPEDESTLTTVIATTTASIPSVVVLKFWLPVASASAGTVLFAGLGEWFSSRGFESYPSDCLCKFGGSTVGFADGFADFDQQLDRLGNIASGPRKVGWNYHCDSVCEMWFKFW
jgi:hypothetical protein